LLYKLRRKYTTKTNNQPNNNATSIEDKATNLYLLVGWKADDCNHGFYVGLIECTDDFTWDESKLWTLSHGFDYGHYKDCESDIITWLMHDGTVMKTRRDITYGSDYKLDIVISEGTRKSDMKGPRKIDKERLVLSFIDIDYINICCQFSYSTIIQVEYS
jgi:hypothetical protein